MMQYLYGAVLCSIEWFEKKLMVVFALAGFRNMLVSILDVFRIRSRSKKFICSLSSCRGLNVIALCIWFILAVIRSGFIFLESYIIKVSSK